jgi:hypothetical protein
MSFAAVASHQTPAAVAEERLTKLSSGLQQFQVATVELQRMVVAMRVATSSSGQVFSQLALVDEMSARLGLALSEGDRTTGGSLRARHAKLHKDFKTVNLQFGEIKALAASKVQASSSCESPSSNAPAQHWERQQLAQVAQKRDEGINEAIMREREDEIREIHQV